MVSDLHHDPLGKIVRIGPLDEAMPEKIAMGMEMDGIERHLFDEFGQFFLVLRLLSQTFLDLAAPDECKRGIGNLMAGLLGHVVHGMARVNGSLHFSAYSAALFLLF